MRTLLATFSIVLAGSGSLVAEVDYLRDVRPVLRERCVSCHGALQQKASLRLDSARRALEGGKRGAVIVAGDASASRLVARVSTKDADERMPPEGAPLSDEEITAIRAWIDAGADAPPDEDEEAAVEEHWAFRAPVRASLPAYAESANPVDAWLEVERQRLGVRAIGREEPGLLLRRLYLDLVGLPPGREDTRAFARDPSDENWNRTVDRLLASPHHGERWGRHFMDIWRYTDWYGLGAQLRNSQKHIWRWRDWIVESLNADTGYDQMLREMLAADELHPDDPERLRATGFLARNYYLFNRTTWLDSTIEHTAKALLGLTLNCAKCHDHKYDPITQVDYYRFRAFFEPHQIRLDTVPGEIDLEKDGLPRAFDAHLDAPTYLHVRGDEKQPDTSAALTPGVPSVLAFAPLELASIELPPEAVQPALRRFVLEDHLAIAQREVDAAREARERTGDHVTEAKLVAALARVDALTTAHAADRARAGLEDASDVDALVRAAARADLAHRRAVARADHASATARADLAAAAEGEEAKKAREQLDAAVKRLEELEREELDPTRYTSLQASLKALEGPDENDASRRQPYPATSTGRRSALARWLTDPRHPLTARVVVNHVWLRHFGRPLVESVDDFGRRAPTPRHLALLDYLALELIESGWSLKHLHRLIVTSNAYRLSGRTRDADAATRAADPTNASCWHRTPVRMESEVLRDSLLALGGALDRRIGGPTIDPAGADTHGRRSLYFTRSRDHQHEFLGMFDDPNILACYRRTDSIVPQQALALANSELSLRLARRAADRLLDTLGASPGDEAFVDAAFRSVLARAPDAEELAVSVAALERLRALARSEGRAAPETHARGVLVHAILNHNDFLTVR